MAAVPIYPKEAKDEVDKNIHMIASGASTPRSHNYMAATSKQMPRARVDYLQNLSTPAEALAFLKDYREVKLLDIIQQLQDHVDASASVSKSATIEKDQMTMVENAASSFSERRKVENAKIAEALEDRKPCHFCGGDVAFDVPQSRRFYLRNQIYVCDACARNGEPDTYGPCRQCDPEEKQDGPFITINNGTTVCGTCFPSAVKAQGRICAFCKKNVFWVDTDNGGLCYDCEKGAVDTNCDYCDMGCEKKETWCKDVPNAHYTLRRACSNCFEDAKVAWRQEAALGRARCSNTGDTFPCSMEVPPRYLSPLNGKCPQCMHEWRQEAKEKAEEAAEREAAEAKQKSTNKRNLPKSSVKSAKKHKS